MKQKGNLSAGYYTSSRRRFFKLLIGETIAFIDELCGRPQFRLVDLTKLSDTALAQIMPMVRPGVKIVVTEQHIGIRRHSGAEMTVLFNSEPANLFVFNRFNGLTTLGHIGEELDVTMSWNEKHGFAYAKRLFLQLVQVGVCVPSNPI